MYKPKNKKWVKKWVKCKEKSGIDMCFERYINEEREKQERQEEWRKYVLNWLEEKKEGYHDKRSEEYLDYMTKFL